MLNAIIPVIILAGAPIPAPTAKDSIVEVLPADAIPAVVEPTFVSASDAEIDDDHFVIGVELGGESHAYALNLLNGREIVNDVVGGTPIAVTW